MECTICLQNWNTEECIPKSLPCGHSFCSQCLAALFAKYKTGIVCPTCMTNHKMTPAEVQSLPKNFSLLALIRDRIAVTKKSPFPSGGLELQSKKQFSPSGPESGPHNAELEQIEKVVSAHPYCEKHRMLLHSYILGTKHLLCDKCISELPKAGAEISHIPKVCRELRQQITKARSILLLRKSEIKRYKTVMNYVAESNKRDAEGTISEYYQKLNEIISESEKRTRERFKGMCDIQQQVMATHNKHMDETYDKLLDYELEIAALNEYDDIDIAYMSKKIEAVLKGIQSKKIEMNSDRLLVKVQIDPTIYDKMGAFIHTHTKLDSSPLLIGNKPVTVNEYVIPLNHWLCTLCGSITSEAQFQCSKCSTFRLLESFPNILENPSKVTEQEIIMLRQRRQQEKLMICGRDLLTSDILPMDECWYIISTDWLTQWKAFIFNKPFKNSRVSPNPTIGVLPPGPISNHLLLLKDKQTLKNGLQRNTDYRGVNEFVWEAFQRIYGGGPVMPRNEIDIYSLPANTRLLDPSVDQNYYRNFERTHKELIDELLKLKKLEKEEKKEGAIEEVYKRIKTLAHKHGKGETVSTEVKREEDMKPTHNLIKNLISLFRK